MQNDMAYLVAAGKPVTAAMHGDALIDILTEKQQPSPTIDGSVSVSHFHAGRYIVMKPASNRGQAELDQVENWQEWI